MARQVSSTPSRGWLRRKGWLLLTLPLGFTTWAAFLYIGLRARRPRWLVWAGVYGGLLAGFLVLDAPHKPSSTAEGVAAALALLCWVGGGIHALAISNDAERKMKGAVDPALDAARSRIERRAEGRRLLQQNPALAKEAGVGRPDRPGADSFGLVDVNHAGAHAIAHLPGVTAELARQIVDARDKTGPFSSVDDLGALLQLPPHVLDEMRDQAVFVPD
ncbi:MAG: helix-hairpin-helix domain-containing protein [Acidimicrobiaceae bacterium]|nr:helix-hairpin-helix domain-containing protein [Acidimicrobiaceae bacterium]